MAADAADQPTSTVVQLPNGRFAPGNPGRKPGSKNKISREALHSIQGMKDDAVQQLWQLVLSGDFKAITYVLDKILPRDRLVQMDDANPSTIADMLANGELTPDEGRSIATALARLTEIGELVDIKQRLAELEAAIAERQR